MCSNQELREEIQELKQLAMENNALTRSEIANLGTRLGAFMHESRNDRQSLRLATEVTAKRLNRLEERVDASVLDRADVTDALMDSLRHTFSPKRVAAAIVGTAAVMVAVREIVQVIMEVLR